MRLAVIAFCCTFCLMLPSLYASVGHLTHVSGLVKVYQVQTGSWVNGCSGLTISSGDRLKTTDGGTAVLSYDDGSELRIKESSSIQFLSSGYRLRYGDTWVRFVKQGNHFRTITPNSVVSVRGTIYTVAVNRDLPTVMSDYRNTILAAPYVMDAPKAHVASSALLLSLLQKAGTVSRVNLYRGSVVVSPLDSKGLPVQKDEKVLTPGMGLVVSAKGITDPIPVASSSEDMWNDRFFNGDVAPAYQKRIEQIKKYGAGASLKGNTKGNGFKLLGENSSPAVDGSVINSQ